MVSVCQRFCRRNGYLAGEILVRLALLSVILSTENAVPFHRKLQPEELWLYKYPRTDSYIPTEALVAICTVVPTIVFMITKFLMKDTADVGQGCLGLSLALGINGSVTNLMKIAVGRPRPDFMYRCFPDGRFNIDLDCTGEPSVINDGLKSFPSGHSSFSFLSLGFTAIFMAGKLKCLVSEGRGQSWRLCLMLTPLVLALGIAVSRTCDYHHHWQDILAGSTIGFSVAYLCYRQYFPSPGSTKCARSYAGWQDDSSPVIKDVLTTVKSV